MTREFIEQLSVVEPYCYETDREERWYKVGLVNGLKIADENPNLESLWHDAREKPQLTCDIIYQDDDNYFEVIDYLDGLKNTIKIGGKWL